MAQDRNMKTTLALILALLSFSSFADELQGKVIKVTDGDTVNVLTSDNKMYRIRLLGIDAPEKKQAFGNRSKQALSEEIGDKTVKVEYSKLDKYQRIVGKIIFNGKDVNLHQIQRGMAWHFKKYEKEQDVEDRAIYANEEYLAQRDKFGLWADANPTPPWGFRKSRKQEPSTNQEPVAAVSMPINEPVIQPVLVKKSAFITQTKSNQCLNLPTDSEVLECLKYNP